MRNWLYKFMQGRYGSDQLGRHMMIAALVPLVLSMFLRYFRGILGTIGVVLYLVAMAMLVVCIFRMFSRNTQKRYAENAAYMRWFAKVKVRFSQWRARFKNRKVYRYFKCPTCKTRTRVPRGKGKVTITCPKCGASFTRKT